MADQSMMSRMGATFLPHLAKRVFPPAWVDADEAERVQLAKRRRSIDGPRPDLALQRKWGRATTEIAGRELHLLTPKDGSTGRVLYYCHGGAFVLGPSAIEWLFVAKIADRLGFDLALFDYPKVPEHDSSDIHAANLAAYDAITERYGADQQLIGGSSAGGALALTTLLQLRRANRPLPSAALLISPWLDMGVSHEDLPSYAESDKLLAPDCLRQDGALYAGATALTDPVISPLFMADDDLGGMPPMVITAGEHEMFMPEIQDFVARLTSSAARVSLHIEAHGQHVGVFAGSPEAKTAVDAAVLELHRLLQRNG